MSRRSYCVASSRINLSREGLPHEKALRSWVLASGSTRQAGMVLPVPAGGLTKGRVWFGVGVEQFQENVAVPVGKNGQRLALHDPPGRFAQRGNHEVTHGLPVQLRGLLDDVLEPMGQSNVETGVQRGGHDSLPLGSRPLTEAPADNRRRR